MTPQTELSNFKALKKLIDCVLKVSKKSDENMFLYYKHLFNVKRLILEIQYENVEKKDLKSFLKDLNVFIENKLQELGTNGECEKILEVLYKYDGLFKMFFEDSFVKNNKIDYYACKGRKIDPLTPVRLGEILKKSTIIEHRIPPGIVKEEDLDKCKNNDKECKESVKDVVKEILLIPKQLHSNAFFVSRQNELTKVISNKEIGITEKLYKIGVNPKEEEYFVIYFSGPKIEIYTPTILDVWMDVEKYFLPSKPDNTDGGGHWGETVSLMDPEKGGVPEAVIKGNRYRLEFFDINYVGEIKNLYNSKGEDSEPPFLNKFISFVKKLQVNYTI